MTTIPNARIHELGNLVRIVEAIENITPEQEAERVNRLLSLASALRKIPSKSFDFSEVFTFPSNKLQTEYQVCNLIPALREESSIAECGAVGCAIGWTPFIFPRLIKFVELSHPPRNVLEVTTPFGFTHLVSSIYAFGKLASCLFGYPNHVMGQLFSPSDTSEDEADRIPSGHKVFSEDSTPTEVAKRIEHFVKSGKILHYTEACF